MPRVPLNGRPSRRRTVLRGWVPLLLVTGGLLVVALAAGWVGWLVDHPGQAWRWVVRHWFVSSALVVFVALLSAWVAWAGPRGQHRRAERLAAAERAWQQQRDQEQRPPARGRRRRRAGGLGVALPGAAGCLAAAGDRAGRPLPRRGVLFLAAWFDLALARLRCVAYAT